MRYLALIATLLLGYFALMWVECDQALREYRPDAAQYIVAPTGVGR